jgi:chromosomal replication initiation ATPase DnaA
MGVLFAPTEGQLKRAAERHARLVRLHVVPKPLPSIVSEIRLISSIENDLPPLPNGCLSEAHRLLSEAAARKLRIQDILQAVADHFDIQVSEIASESRKADIVWPRQIAVYLCRTLTAKSLLSISPHFGARDHATLIHACRKVTAKLSDDTGLRATIEHLCRRLGVKAP